MIPTSGATAQEARLLCEWEHDQSGHCDSLFDVFEAAVALLHIIADGPPQAHHHAIVTAPPAPHA